MTVQELAGLLDARILNPDVPTDMQVQCGYTCDLLSWVMTHGAGGTAWITVMTHMNAVAVATLLEFSCVIVPEGIAVGDPVLKKATEEGLAILSSSQSAYELSGKLFAAGILPAERK